MPFEKAMPHIYQEKAMEPAIKNKSNGPIPLLLFYSVKINLSHVDTETNGECVVFL